MLSKTPQCSEEAPTAKNYWVVPVTVWTDLVVAGEVGARKPVFDSVSLRWLTRLPIGEVKRAGCSEAKLRQEV